MLDRPTSNLVTLRDAEKRTRQLGTLMFELNANGVTVDQDNINLHAPLFHIEGFSAHEMRSLLPAAQKLANDRFVRFDEPADATPRPVRKTLDERMTLAADACLDEICDRLAAELTRAAETIDEVTWRKLVSKTAHRLATSPVPANLGAEVAARRSGVA